MILTGTLLAAGATLPILAYALAGGHVESMLIYMFFPMNIGLGLRGHERAASLAILAIMAVSALGTVLLAPFISQGLVALAAAATISQVFALIALAFLPRSHPQ